MLEQSILLSIKKLLGLNPAYEEAFDMDIIIHINTVLNILHQLGVGPDEGLVIKNDSEKWNDFLEDETMLEMVKSYVYMKVRLIFDPPSGSVQSALTETITELEWRITVMVDELEN